MFHDLTPKFSPGPYRLTQTNFVNTEGAKVNMTRVELRDHRHRFLCGDNKVERYKDDQLVAFELFKNAPGMLTLLVKLRKCEALSGIDADFVDELIEKFYISKK